MCAMFEFEFESLCDVVRSDADDALQRITCRQYTVLMMEFDNLSPEKSSVMVFI